MFLLHYSVEQLKKDLLLIIRKHYTGNFKIFFFGSRLTQNMNDRSDIDVGFLPANRLQPSVLNLIKEDIDALPLLYTIDFIDFSNVSDQFSSVALQQTEMF